MPVGDVSAFYPTNYLSSKVGELKDFRNKLDLEKWYRYDQYQFDFKLFKRATGMTIKEIYSYLDIGAGSGERVSYLKENGCKNSQGLDKFTFIKEKIKKEAEIINSDILDFKPNKKFQTISLAHVLEHLENPKEVLLHIRENILTKNGYLFIQVPNYNSFERYVFKSKWFCFDAPRHLWHFNRKSLQKLLSSFGYKIEGCYSLNALFHPVSIVPSIFKKIDIQRIWIDHPNGTLSNKIFKLLWIGLTLATVPLSLFQNIFNRGSMLTIIASNNIDD
jgi:2-polyprenyl-3-methyl-5-hydroxy-6-metoxy-1,4-benzoquinol methylase